LLGGVSDVVCQEDPQLTVTVLQKELEALVGDGTNVPESKQATNATAYNIEWTSVLRWSARSHIVIHAPLIGACRTPNRMWNWHVTTRVIATETMSLLLPPAPFTTKRLLCDT
jgi:hypothetical protein